MKLHRGLEVPQKRPGTWRTGSGYIADREKNKHASKKLNKGRGPVRKAAVIGMKDREPLPVDIPCHPA